MFGTGVVAALFAKLAGLGSAAKVAVATATAALTMTAAGAAAGVLPFGGGNSAPAVTSDAIGQVPVVVEQATSTAPAETDFQGGDATAGTPGSAPVDAGADAGLEVEPVPVPTSSLPVPGAELPDLSAFTQVPAQVLSCLTPLLDLATALPTVPMEQIAQIGPTVVGCVSGIVEDLPLPFGLNACISEILGFVSDMTSQLPAPGIPDVGGFDVAACIPTGLPMPAGLPGASTFMGGGFPFGTGVGFPFGG